MTVLVLDDEVKPDTRYLGPEIAHFVGDADYHVYADDPETPPLDRYDGLVISGSTASVYESGHPFIERQEALVRECLDREFPVLGVCFGHQLVNQAFGGRVEEDRRRATFVEMTVHDPTDPVLGGVEPVVPVLHSDLVVETGAGMETIASVPYNEAFCTRHESAPIWTVQYHPEFTERVEEKGNGWDPGDHSFAESNAVDTITNFVAECERRARLLQ